MAKSSERLARMLVVSDERVVGNQILNADSARSALPQGTASSGENTNGGNDLSLGRPLGDGCYRALKSTRARRQELMSRQDLGASMSEEVKLFDEADRLKAAGELDQAVAKLQAALAVNEKYALAHSALAVALQKLGQHEEALKHARRVAELEPMDPFSYTALSVTYQRAYAGTGNMEYIRLAEDAMERSRQLSGGR
jgi:tetratricopeptide (TPR) repeat protein